MSQSEAWPTCDGLRVCHHCDIVIPEDEKAVLAKTGNAWMHFECWYDGAPFLRDPRTGLELAPLRGRSV